MKKYLAAGAVAIMVFAFAAMAASLNVTSDRLAAGVDNVACAEDALVSYDVSNDGQGSWVRGFDITFSDTTCDGEYVNLAIFDAPAGVPNVAPQQVMNANVGQVSGGSLSYELPGAAHGHLRVEDVEQIQVLVGASSDAFVFVSGPGIVTP